MRDNEAGTTGPPKISISFDEKIEKLQRDSVDRYGVRLLFYYRDRDIRHRIHAAAAYYSRQMARRHHAGSSDFEHEVEDLIQYAWRIVLQRRPEIDSPASLLDRFAKIMRNYCRGRRRTKMGRSFLDTNVDEPGNSLGNIICFPTQERQMSAKQSLELLRQKVRSDAPELEPLLLAFMDGCVVARDQAAELELPIEEIYAMRRRLKLIAVQLLNSDQRD